jgi:hypothetical protein
MLMQPRILPPVLSKAPAPKSSSSAFSGLGPYAYYYLTEGPDLEDLLYYGAMRQSAGPGGVPMSPGYMYAMDKFDKEDLAAAMYAQNMKTGKHKAMNPYLMAEMSSLQKTHTPQSPAAASKPSSSQESISRAATQKLQNIASSPESQENTTDSHPLVVYLPYILIGSSLVTLLLLAACRYVYTQAEKGAGDVELNDEYLAHTEDV